MMERWTNEWTDRQTKKRNSKKQFFKKIPRGVYSGVYIFARISYIHIYMHTYTYIPHQFLRRSTIRIVASSTKTPSKPVVPPRTEKYTFGERGKREGGKGGSKRVPLSKRRKERRER